MQIAGIPSCNGCLEGVPAIYPLASSYCLCLQGGHSTRRSMASDHPGRIFPLCFTPTESLRRSRTTVHRANDTCHSTLHLLIFGLPHI